MEKKDQKDYYYKKGYRHGYEDGRLLEVDDYSELTERDSAPNILLKKRTMEIVKYVKESVEESIEEVEMDRLRHFVEYLVINEDARVKMQKALSNEKRLGEREDIYDILKVYWEKDAIEDRETGIYRKEGKDYEIVDGRVWIDGKDVGDLDTLKKE